MTLLRAILFLIVASSSVQAWAQLDPQELAEQKKKLALALGSGKILQDRLNADAISPLTSLQATLRGTFWRDPDWVKLLSLSSDQQKRMDDIFQQYRLKLIDLTASLKKEELMLEPLIDNGPPTPETEPKMLNQVDRIADARAELEKANSRMLIGIFQVLTPEQWSKLPMPSRKKIRISAPQSPK
jgi:Spy/CpxP family protein refolding chaperone